MGLRFTVLASGSSGNAALLETADFALLIDAGLTARELAARLKKAGVTWQRINAVVLTHTHSDHWNDGILGLCRRRPMTLHCHAEHCEVLRRGSRLFGLLESAQLVREYENDVETELAAGLRCRPIAVRHDSGAAFGFRFEASPDLFGATRAIGYASDLGCWDEATAAALANVDLLAIEHNHDEAMQLQSRRPQRLIARVLGNEGHLSNRQASELIKVVLQMSEPERLRHVVQLHLSRECNRPKLAVAAAKAVLAEMHCSARIHTASQQHVLAPIRLDVPARQSAKGKARSTSKRRAATAAQQPTLPGLDAI